MSNLPKNKKEQLEVNWDEDKKWRKVYEPYTSALGYAVVSWNRLHANLANIFGLILGIDNTAIARAIWNAPTQDRTARDILWELALVQLDAQPVQLKAVEWLLEQVENLSGDRNAGVHAPLIVRTLGPELFTVVPDHGTGNKKAISLKDKELIPEFIAHADKATLLCEYALQLTRHLWQPELYSLPPKPGEPHFPQTDSQAEQSQQRAAKQLARQQQVAQAMAGEKKAKKPSKGK